MEEIWKDIEGYEGLYQVSNIGNVRSLNYHRTGKKQVLKPFFQRKGYLLIDLLKNGKRQTVTVHKLVAETFIPNDDPEHKTQVNHINEDKTDNRVCNLEWCDGNYNCNYGNRNKRLSESLSRAVKQLSLDGTLVIIWPSVMEAQRNGFLGSSISRCCNGKYTQHKGYKWEWVC